MFYESGILRDFVCSDTQGLQYRIKRVFTVSSIKVCRTEVIVLILATLAVVYRLLILHVMPNVFHSDHAIVALMAKHIYQLGEFPIFFYGQDWFGTIESFLDAAYFMLFGISAKTIKYAPLTFYVLFMFLTYLLTVELYGKKEGLWALAWCIFPAKYLLDFSFNPQGGYIETLTLGSLVLWLSVKLVKAKNERIRTWLYICLGLAAGFAWWTSPLDVYFLLSSAVFVLFSERGRLFFWRWAVALLSFVIGSLPFWAFHIIHGLSLGGFTGGFHINMIWNGLKNLFSSDLWVFLDGTLFGEKYSLFFWCIVSFYSLGFLTIFPSMFKDLKRLFAIRRQENVNGRSLVLLFVLVFCFIYSSSELGHRGVLRYLLALFSIIPIMIGVLLARLGQIWRMLPYLLIAATSSLHIFIFTDSHVAKAPIVDDIHRTMKVMNEQFLEKDIHALYAPYHYAPRISFLSDEKVIAITPTENRYPPYQDVLEQAQFPAFMFFGKGNLMGALRYLGGKSSTGHIGTCHYYYQMEAPKDRYQEILPLQWRSWTDDNPERSQYAYDRDISQFWGTRGPQREGNYFLLDLGEIQKIGKIVVFNQAGHFKNYPKKFVVEVSLDQQKWTEISRSNDFYYYYWSGPRLYPWGHQFRWELRFKPTQARFIRITQNGMSPMHPWEINEIFVYQYMDSQTNWKQRLDPLVTYLIENKFSFVYADRWLSAHIKHRSGEKIGIIEAYTDPLFKRRGISLLTVYFKPKAAFVVLEENQKAFEHIIHQLGFEMQKKRFGSYVLYYFAEWTQKHQRILEPDTSLAWIGFCLVDHNLRVRSDVYKGYAIWLMKENRYDEALQYIDQALLLYSNHQEAQRQRAIILKRLGNVKESQMQWKALHKSTVPRVGAFCQFQGGIEFLGYSVDRERYRPGDLIHIDYYWRFMGQQPRNWYIFVHFEGAGVLFQNDHSLYNLPVLEGEIIKEHFSVKIPENAIPGQYKIGLGLFERYGKKRRKILHSVLKHRFNKVYVGKFEIESPKKMLN